MHNQLAEPRSASERSLIAEIAELRSLADNAAVGLTRCSRDLRYLSANRAYGLIVGVPVARLLGRPIGEVIGAAAFDVIRPHVQRVLAGERVEFEAELPLSEGGTRWVHAVYTPEAGPQGIEGWVGSVSDVSARRRAEDALLQRNRQLDLLARCGQALAPGAGPPALGLQTLLAGAGQVLDMELMFCFLVDGACPGVLRLAASTGLSPGQIEAFARIEFGQYLCGTVAARRERMVVEDLERCDFPEAAALRADGVRCYAGIPLLLRDQVLGTVAFATRRRSRFAEGELHMLQAVCDQAAAALAGAAVQERLRASEERLAAVFRGTAVGMAVLDLDTRVLQVNDSYCRITGYAREELAALDAAALAHPDDRPSAWAAVAAVVAGRVASAVLEQRCRRKDGAQIWVSNSVSLVRDAAGVPLHLVMLCEDITERKRTELLLLEHKRILERIAGGSALADCLLLISGAAARLQAGTRGAVFLADDACDHLATCWSEDIPASFGRALEGRPINAHSQGTCGIAIHSAQPVVCEDIAAPSGRWSPLWRELCLAHGIRACCSQPVMGRSGRAMASFMLCLDEPRGPSEWELRLAAFGAQAASIAIERDRSARERSGQVRRLAELATRLNGLHDVRAVLDLVNEAARALIGAHQCATSLAVKGEWAQSMVAVSLSDKYARWRDYDAAPDGSGIYARVCESGRPMRLTQAELEAHPRYQRFSAHADAHPPLRGWLAAPLTGLRDGNVGLVQLSDKLEGEFDADDEAVLVQICQTASVAIDNAQLFAELRLADRRKDEFLATLAHELRNPLAPLRNGLQVLELACADADAGARTRAMMERQLAQMVRLIDDLLDVSRISRGKIELRRERADLAAVVQQAVETSRPLIEAGRHELRIHLAPRRLEVDGDVLRLAQVVANLLNNAAKYTEPGGRITLAVEEHGGQAAISVRDTGVGIEPQVLPELFCMFTQLDAGAARAQGGLGIGLALVKGLVELHGGSVEAHSRGRGAGSEFVVRLPLAAPAQAAAPDAGRYGDDGGSTARRRKRVLVVDDNRDAATSLSMMLELMGHETHTAHDGEQALAAAAAFRPELMLLDIGMPGRDGYAVCRALRAEPWGQDMTLVALTGWGQEEDRRKSGAAGFDAHLVKPVDLGALGRLLAAETGRAG